MLEEDFQREIKVLVVGNGGVGKTSLIRQFCKGAFVDEYKKTVGVDFLEKVHYVKSLGEDTKLMLWDTAGQEEFHSMTKSYFRGAGAAVLTFSTVDRASFESIPRWKEKVENECGDIAMVLVQNKVDLLDHTVISREESEDLANRVALKFYRICVKENLNVSEVFEYLVELNSKKELLGRQTRSLIKNGSIGLPKLAAPDPVIEDLTNDDEAITEKPLKLRTKGRKSLQDRIECSIL